jgi:hypothetical protein
MPPASVSSPQRRFVLTQTISGIETNVTVSSLLPNNFITDGPQRAAALADAYAHKNAQPSILYRLYSPTNSGAHTDSDCIWRSDIDYRNDA